MTVTGKTIVQNLENVKFNENQKVVFSVSKAISTRGGVVALKSSPAPEGVIAKVARMNTLQFSDPARIFDCEEDCFRAIETRDDKTGEILVIGYDAPTGVPARKDVLTHAVGKAEVVCYADI